MILNPLLTSVILEPHFPPTNLIENHLRLSEEIFQTLTALIYVLAIIHVEKQVFRWKFWQLYQQCITLEPLPQPHKFSISSSHTRRLHCKTHAIGMNTYLIVNIRMPEVLLLNPRVSNPDTYKFLFLLFWKHLQRRTRSVGGRAGQSRAADELVAEFADSKAQQRRQRRRRAHTSAAPRSPRT